MIWTVDPASNVYAHRALISEPRSLPYESVGYGAAGTIFQVRSTLDGLMEFGSVIRVLADGTVDGAPTGLPYVPESLYLDVDADGNATPGADAALEADLRGGWELMTGYTGQYGYRGPVMHASEFIGGGMADYILSTPGLYVSFIVDVEPLEDGDSEPAGWAVATLPDA